MIEMEDVPREDREVILSLLQMYRDLGVDKPLIPMEVDIDGDGFVDAFGLDADGNIAIFSDVNIEDTIYLSEGEDVGPY